jgi:hypothetical protein
MMQEYLHFILWFEDIGFCHFQDEHAVPIPFQHGCQFSLAGHSPVLVDDVGDEAAVPAEEEAAQPQSFPLREQRLHPLILLDQLQQLLLLGLLHDYLDGLAQPQGLVAAVQSDFPQQVAFGRAQRGQSEEDDLVHLHQLSQ